MTLYLSDEETAALARLLTTTIDDDRYPLSPRIQTLKAILEGDPREDPAGAGAAARAPAEALRAAARYRGQKAPGGPAALRSDRPPATARCFRLPCARYGIGGVARSFTTSGGWLLATSRRHRVADDQGSTHQRSIHSGLTASLRAGLPRVAPETTGAPVYRRTAAGRLACSVEIRAGSADDAQQRRGPPAFASLCGDGLTNIRSSLIPLSRRSDAAPPGRRR